MKINIKSCSKLLNYDDRSMKNKNKVNYNFGTQNCKPDQLSILVNDCFCNVLKACIVMINN